MANINQDAKFVRAVLLHLVHPSMRTPQAKKTSADQWTLLIYGATFLAQVLAGLVRTMCYVCVRVGRNGVCVAASGAFSAAIRRQLFLHMRIVCFQAAV